MRRRNYSMAENLEPRLVLSALSPRGSVDPPSAGTQDGSTRQDTVDSGVSQNYQTETSGRTLIVRDVPSVPVADSVSAPVEPLIIVDGSTGVIDVRSGAVTTVVDTSSSRSLSLSDDLADDGLSGDTLETDDRTAVLVDVASGDDVVRSDGFSDADGTVDTVNDRLPLRSETSRPGRIRTSALPGNVAREALSFSLGDRELTKQFRTVQRSDVSTLLPTETQASAGFGAASWMTKLTDSVKSWLNLGNSVNELPVDVADAGVPYVAIAGGFTLAAVGRKGVSDSEAFEVDDSGFVFGKAERRSARWSERRKLRWFGLASKDRRSRSVGAAPAASSTPENDLSTPELSDAFVMSLMNPVSQDAFLLTPMPGEDDCHEDGEDSSLSLKLVAAGAVTVTGGTCVARSRSGRKQTQARPTIDYSGTTLPRTT